MSIRHVRWALELEDARLRPSDKLALVALGAALDGGAPERGTWIGLETVAAQVGVAYRNARSIVRRLVEFGFVEREARPGRSSVYRLPTIPTQDARIPGRALGEDARIPTPGMHASPPTTPPGMSASSHPGCTHPRPGMHASPDPSSIHQGSISPPTPHVPSPEAPPPRSTADGGGDCSLGESFSASAARLVRFWSERIAPLDPRVLAIEDASNTQVRMFRDALRRCPDLETRLPEALDPVAEWVSVTITPELLFKSPSALSKAIGGIYRERDAERLEAIRLARKAVERARELEERRKNPRSRLTEERALAEDVPA